MTTTHTGAQGSIGTLAPNPEATAGERAPNRAPVPSASAPVTTHIHLCLDVEGALRTYRQWAGAFHENGRRLSAAEVRKYLIDQLALGRRVIPLTEPPCEGFSYETGCPGHPVATMEQPT